MIFYSGTCKYWVNSGNSSVYMGTNQINILYSGCKSIKSFAEPAAKRGFTLPLASGQTQLCNYVGFFLGGGGTCNLREQKVPFVSGV